MSEVSFDIKGLDAIEKELEKLPRRVQRKISTKALKEGAKLIRDKAKALAPKKSGTLSRAMTIAVKKSKGAQATVLILPAKGKNRKYDAFYAHFIEFGTDPHDIKGKKHPGTKAQPFLGPAAEIMADRAIKVVGETMADEILKAVKRGD